MSSIGPSKSAHTFTMFDIKDFYPSRKESLLSEALNFAKAHTTIGIKEMETIFHARKSLIFDNNGTWIKKEGGLFDVTMGAYDGAEVCELVGTYLLSLIAERYSKNQIALYRDDGIAIFKNTSGPKNEKIKKESQEIFKCKGLDIVIQCNLKVVDYLDVTLNLNDESFKPFRKPDDETNYIHVESDHPPNIIKRLPIAVEKRISDLSSSEEIFIQSKQHYQDALVKSVHTYELKYNPSVTSGNQRRNRKRKIIWFNPPFSKMVTTNICKKFLNLIDKYFPRNHKFHKLFNRNNVKVSYGCMPNIRAAINAHNKKILGDKTPLVPGECNCNNKNERPLNGECKTSNVLYEARINSNLRNYREKIYKGITASIFKTRYGNHKKSFNNIKYYNESELSKEVWIIKNRGGEYNIKWKIIQQYPAYTLRPKNVPYA